MILKYKEMMDTIRVTPEMRERVLEGMEARRAREIRKKRAMRRVYACAAGLAACLALALTLGHFLEKAQVPGEPDETLVMNPYGATECASLEELSQALGFAVKVPSALPFNPETVTYSAMFEKFAQIDYGAGNASLCVRMEPGTEDISGDYNVYEKEERVEMGGWSVLLKGNGDGVSLATWTDGEYAYSISAEPAISREEMLKMISSEE